ncbi:unnamed protein product [Adineta steineri]|uniref:Uncharacterized protein n=1 Tax=Adineta steineri TaxID=433720 RepID=A0A819Q6B6_9BILA|nr:unnamed protein product [Adineta steineri]
MAARKAQENFDSVFSSGASDTSLTRTALSARQHMAQNYLLVWVDESIDETSKNYENTLTQLRAAVNDVTMYTQPDECIKFLGKLNDEKAFVIISDSLGQHLVPEIHDMPKLDAIYIFCDNISYQQQWIKNWKKIRGVHNNIKDICNALKRGVRQVNQDSIPISFLAADNEMPSENLNQLEPNYMYTQIFKEILLQMEHDHKQAIKILAVYYREFYHDNIAKLNIIDEFEHNYRPEKAIWWYTRESFTFEILNRALQTLDTDIIINMGFFIHDLHQQIYQLHQQQLPNYHDKSFLVYRGQGLLKSDFDKLIKTKGGLMSFNSFLSTSTDEDISRLFAESSSGNPDIVEILFIMTIDPRVSSTPFASIGTVSYYQTEEEILLSMHTVFRVGAIKKMDKNNDQCYQVDLQLTADDDDQLRQLTKSLSKQAAGETGWERLGSLLLTTGHFDTAEKLHKLLLEQPSNDNEKARYYNNLGYIKQNQSAFQQALEYHKIALGIQDKALPTNHPGFASSYNNIGLVYDIMGDYLTALSFYEKALGIREKTLPANHPELATSYGNIGQVYHSMGEYSKALSFYDKALGIREITLPANHPDLANSYNNIGQLYDSMGEYLTALSFHEKALGIREKTLPANHPDLASAYNNIGCVYDIMGEYSKALSFYEKALAIRKKNLSANHPELATCYSNSALVYDKMGEYSKALSFYEKALGIQEKTLPTNHLSLATSYNNIGCVYDNLGEYSKALSFCEKATEIREKALPINHSDLASAYNNIGVLYRKMGEYSKALSFHEKALGIRETNLSANHANLATSYSTICVVYYDMGEYLSALSFYEKALAIQEKTLPANHPDLATSYNNSGLVYDNMGEYLKALLFYEKALGIQEKTIPANYSGLATSYNNTGLVYNHMGEYSKALSFYEKALGIDEKTRSANHLSLATSYSNLGSLYYKVKEYSKTLSYLERALDIFELSLPSDHPQLRTVKQRIEIVTQKL